MPAVTVVDLITPERVLLGLKADAKGDIIQALARVAEREAEVNQRLVAQAILDHDDLTTFAIGPGLALPHASIPGLRHPLLVLAVLSQAADFGAADGSPADVVALVLAPLDRPPLLLQALSFVARRLRDPNVAERLRAATSEEEAYSVLTSDAWRDCPPPDRGT